MGRIFKGKDTSTQDQVIDTATPEMKAAQGKALSQYSDLLNQDTAGMAAKQTALQERQIRQNSADRAQQITQMSAQRGIGGNSMGIRALLNNGDDVANQIGANRSNEELLANQMKQQNLNTATQGIGSINNAQQSTRLFKQGQNSRSGGIGGLLGAAAGAMLAPPGMGAQGASMGMQAGNMLGNI